jgi:hypothetical protein
LPPSSGWQIWGHNDGGSLHLWNVGLLLCDFTELRPRKLSCSTVCLLKLKLEIIHLIYLAWRTRFTWEYVLM